MKQKTKEQNVYHASKPAGPSTVNETEEKQRQKKRKGLESHGWNERHGKLKARKGHRIPLVGDRESLAGDVRAIVNLKSVAPIQHPVFLSYGTEEQCRAVNASWMQGGLPPRVL